MAIVDLGLLGTGSSKTAATTLAVVNTTGAIIPAGTLIHITGCWDNIASVTAPTITCSTVGGATATVNHATAIGSGVTTTAGSGVWHSCVRALTTADIASGGTIATLTSNQSAVARAAHAEGWSGVTATLRGTVTTATSTTGSPSVASTGTALVAGDLVIGSVSFENNAQMTADADTLNGTWDAIVGTFTTGAGAATNVGTGTQDKVVTAPGAQTYNPTGGSGDTVACIYSLVPTPAPTITQAAYRFYADGIEAFSTALAAENTAYTADVSSGDLNLLVRMMLQSTNTTDVPATDDFTLQWLHGDSYGIDQWSGQATVTLYNAQTQTAQSFIGTGGPLTSATFWLYRISSPTGTIAAALWAHDGGTFGSTGLPTGSPLAVSASVDPMTVSTVQIPPAPYTFVFDGSVILTPGTQYFIGLIVTGAGSPGVGTISAARDFITPTHPGSYVLFTTGWAVNPGDLLFQIGTWTKPGDSSVQFDGYDETNQDGTTPLGDLANGRILLGQSFRGNGSTLVRAGFYLAKVGTPVGPVSAALYAHTGTFGTFGNATGSPLAVSTNTVAISALGTGYAWYYFDFDGTFTMTNTTPYVIAVSVPSAAASAGIQVSVGADLSSSTHAGNTTGSTNGTTWASPSGDLVFKVFSAGAVTVAPYSSPNLADTGPTTNRLSAGTGSFVAGKISEDGIVDDLGWSGNNYTELLYAITLKAADLANSDTLRFRVIDSNTEPVFTYTQTPTLNILIGGATYSATASLAVTATGTATAASTKEITATLAVTATLTPTAVDVIPITATRAETVTFTSTAVKAVPAVAQDAYRFYADGTETGSVALVAENTSYTADVTSGDVNVLLRVRLQSTTVAAIPATDYFQLQWDVNASGSWSSLFGSVVPFASANLTDTAATTQRLSAGSGSFVAGEISEDGLVDDLGWTASNYTEVLYSITLKQSLLANGDTLTFRVLKDASTFGMTYTQTPAIPVVKGAVKTATASLAATTSLTASAAATKGITAAVATTAMLAADITQIGVVTHSATASLAATTTLTATFTLVSTTVVVEVIGSPVSGHAMSSDVVLTFSTPPILDDVTVLIGGHYNRGTAGPVTSGYSVAHYNNTTEPYFGMWYKRQGSSPDTTVTGLGSGNSEDASAYVAYVLRGVNVSSPLDFVAVGTAGLDPLSVTVATNGSLVIAATGLSRNADVTPGTITGYTNTVVEVG